MFKTKQQNEKEQL